jgi:hypothetical protein
MSDLLDNLKLLGISVTVPGVLAHYRPNVLGTMRLDVTRGQHDIRSNQGPATVVLNPHKVRKSMLVGILPMDDKLTTL